MGIDRDQKVFYISRNAITVDGRDVAGYLDVIDKREMQSDPKFKECCLSITVTAVTNGSPGEEYKCIPNQLVMICDNKAKIKIFPTLMQEEEP